MHKVKPSIYLLAVTSISKAGLSEYLDDIGADWKSNAPTDVEEIVEVAGRSCYMSFPKTGGGYVNPNVSSHRRANSKYLEHILEEGNGSILEHAWCAKGGKEDLLKAIHYLEAIIEHEYNE